jgi:hypothetical protein
MKDDDDLKDLFKRAAEISKSVPEPLREAAFNRAVDALLGTSSSAKAESSAAPSKASKSPQKQAAKGIENKADHLLENLNRTAYPQVGSAPRVLERALHLLRIAHDDFGIDGIGGADIARILTEKFRLRTTRQAVGQALDVAKDYVDRSTSSGRTVYRIMHAGEQYLDSGEYQSAEKGTSRPARKSKNAKSSGRKQSSKGEKQNKATKKKASGGRPGPRVALNELVDAGHFDVPRRMADIQQHLAHTKAHSYKSRDLSPTLIRMLRDGVLVRNRAEDGQYEYKRK